MSSLRVLIAEDEPISAELLSHLVEQEGHQACGTVTRGAEVPDAVARLTPDVVLMDVHLADNVTGIAAIRDLLRKTSVPVIVISGTDSRAEMEDIAQSGALGFIKKPVSADELRVNLRLATHHNEVLHKLRDSELLHRSLFDNAAVGIYVCDPEGFYLATNLAFARMLGYAGPSEILRSVRSIDEQVYVEEGRRQTLLQKLAEGGEVRDFESAVYGRDGDILWVAEHLAPHLDDQGRLEHYEGVVINVTDRKRAEDALHLAHNMVQTTMDAIAQCIAVTDLQGNIIMSNKAFERDLAQVFADQVLRCLPASDGSDIFVDFLKKTAENAHDTTESRGRIRLEGIEREMRATITRYCARDGGVVGAVFVLEPL